MFSCNAVHGRGIPIEDRGQTKKRREHQEIFYAARIITVRSRIKGGSTEGANYIKRSNGDSTARGDLSGAGPIRERKIDAPSRARREAPWTRPHRNNPRKLQQTHQTGSPANRFRHTGRYSLPSLDGSRDARVLRDAEAPARAPALGEGSGGGGGDRGARAGEVREHHNRKQLHPRRLRRGEEAREHRARDAGEPFPPHTGRAYLRLGLHGGAPPRADARFAGEEGKNGNYIGAPALEPRLPDVRQSCGSNGGTVFVLWQRKRRHALLSVGRVRAVFSDESG